MMSDYDCERDRELEAWRDEWQALGDAAALTDVLAERCVRDGRRLWRSLAYETLAGIFSSVVVIGLIVRAHGRPAVAAVCGVILVFNGVWVTRFHLARQGQLTSIGAGLDRFVALTRDRLAADVALVRFALVANVALAAAVLPGVAWILLGRLDLLRREPWRAAVAVGAIVSIHVALFFWIRRKRAKALDEQARFEALVARGSLE
jgi:hypothetical protein